MPMNREDLKKGHVAIPGLVDDLERGRVGRRDFLRTTTLLGLSAAPAYALDGTVTGGDLVRTALAQAEPKTGGDLSIGLYVLALNEPTVQDRNENCIVTRADSIHRHPISHGKSTHA